MSLQSKWKVQKNWSLGPRVVTRWSGYGRLQWPKLSILGFYLRFFKSPYERAITYLLMAITVANFASLGLTATFECTPVSYQWEQTKEGAKGKCIDVAAFYDWMSFPNIVTDAVLLVLPLPMIFRLQLSRHQKVGLVFIFATGGA